MQNEKNELMKSATFNSQPALVSNMVESNPNEEQTKLRGIKNSQNSQNQEKKDENEEDENKPVQSLIDKITYQPEEIEKEKENQNILDNAQDNTEQPKVEQEGSPNENKNENPAEGGLNN